MRHLRQLLLAALFCFPSGAAIVPPFTLEQLTQQSEIIAHGRVTRSWCAWDQGHKYIWTHYSLTVIDPILGTRASSVEISEPGGSIDGFHMQVSGSVSYAAGEEVIVFLYRTPIRYWRAFGGAQGKFTLDSNQLVTRSGLTVSEFKSRVREVIRRGR